MTQRIDEAGFVRAQYESEDNLRARKAAYVNAEGDDPREFAFEAVAEVAPQRVLEVGGGEGELAERIRGELGAEVIAMDQSERMVEIQRSKGIDARVGDVQTLPFADGEFDVVLAAWMLYHVPDLDRGLAEIARVLKPSGRLVAVTNAIDHLQELWDLAGRVTALQKFTFRSENGEESLRRHFASVTRREAHGWATMDEEAVRRFGASWADLASLVTAGPFAEPLRVRRHSTIFVAETA
ncbi:MAG: class I SAM-dependent methyltransferase [Actinobacteria bacterium]|nr:MAG: class I SAM-dependent methyltransferase [Actinomycetota bacterium]